MGLRPSAAVITAGVALFASGIASAHADEPKLPKWVTDAGPPWQPPPQGVVRDARAAISIAHAVWFSVRGDIRGPIPTENDWQKSMVATLNDGVWEVTERAKPGEIGGSLFIFISQKDGRVLNISLTQ